MQILVSIGAVGASSQIGKILPLCDFFDCPVLSCSVLFSRSRVQVEPLNRFSQFLVQATCFRVSIYRCLLEDETTDVVILKKYEPNLLPLKMAVNSKKRFQAKTPK